MRFAGIKRVALPVWPRARRVDEGDALGDEAPDSGRSRSLDQVVAALGPRPVGGPVVDLAGVVLAGKAGELTDHDLRANISHGGLDRCGVFPEIINQRRVDEDDLTRFEVVGEGLAQDERDEAAERADDDRRDAA